MVYGNKKNSFRSDPATVTGTIHKSHNDSKFAKPRPAGRKPASGPRTTSAFSVAQPAEAPAGRLETGRPRRPAGRRPAGGPARRWYASAFFLARPAEAGQLRPEEQQTTYGCFKYSGSVYRKSRAFLKTLGLHRPTPK